MRIFIRTMQASMAMTLAGYAAQTHDVRLQSVSVDTEQNISAALLKGKPEVARETLAAGLRNQPQNGYLHLLNGLTYQIEDNSLQSLDLAKVGYDAAVKFAPGHYWSHYLAGSVALDLQSYAEAAEHFSQAILNDPDRPQAFLGLAVSAYFTRDLDVAQAAADRALVLLPKDPLALRTAAYVAAARGERARLDVVLARAQTVPIAARDLDLHKTRLTQLLRTATLAQAQGDSGEKQLESQSATATSPKENEVAKPTENAGTNQAESGAAKQAESEGAKPAENEPAKQTGRDVSIEKQAETQPAPVASPKENEGAKQTGQGSSVERQSESQPALVTTSKEKESPKQVMVEVTLLLNQALNVHNTGINLLDGLTVQFGLDYQYSATSLTPGARSFSRVFTSAIKMPQITYSLNLFNTKTDYYRVIARPSLVAWLDQPSEFFIGRSVDVGVSGINLGSVQHIDIGTTVKVTPIEITPTRARFRIEVIRSFPSTETAGTFPQSLTTFKQTVAATAEVEFGKTLVLSGLYEGVNTRGSSKTPLLGDTPGLRTLFNARTDTERRDVALVLVTPRLAGSVETDTHEFRSDTLKKLLSVWKDVIEPTSNMDVIIGATERRGKGPWLHQPKMADLRLPPVSEPDTIKAVVKETLAQLH